MEKKVIKLHISGSGLTQRGIIEILKLASQAQYDILEFIHDDILGAYLTLDIKEELKNDH